MIPLRFLLSRVEMNVSQKICAHCGVAKPEIYMLATKVSQKEEGELLRRFENKVCRVESGEIIILGCHDKSQVLRLCNMWEQIKKRL